MDVRFVFVRIDIQKNVVASIIILTPEYIEQKFGRFGKPTVKQQLLISNKARRAFWKVKKKYFHSLIQKSYPITFGMIIYLQTQGWLQSRILRIYFLLL